MKPVFFDIDTQIDFLFPAGSLYVPGAERLIPKLAFLNRYAAAHHCTVVSSMCAHAENDPEFRQWPAHCVLGTVGQLKPAETLLENRAVISVASGENMLAPPQQILFEKNQLDITGSPHFQPLLHKLDAGGYVVYGVVTEYCVRFAALALLATGKPVSLVTDAIETLAPAESGRTLSEFTSSGGRLVTVGEVCLDA